MSKSWLMAGMMAAFFCRLALADGAPEAAKPDPDKLNVTFGGFIDAYYDYDFNTPPTIDRSLVTGVPFGTQAIRTNEFNINLAYAEAKLSSDRVHGRLALQTGTSVQANYAGEANALGVVKGPLPAELIQEAYAGYRIADGLWVDAGIFFSHIGFEGFISRDNWNYTRSIMADYSPYYETGVRLSYQISPIWSAQFLILNGWQNIYENNQNKAVGLQLSYNPSDRLTLTYNNFLGQELTNQPRFFNDFIARYSLTDAVQVAALFDVGSQATADHAGTDYWYAGALLARWQVTSTLALAARLEEYVDRHQVIIQTGTPDGFMSSGASLNADVQLQKNLVWRSEVRGFASPDAIFASSSGPINNDKFVVTSFGLSF